MLHRLPRYLFALQRLAGQQWRRFQLNAHYRSAQISRHISIAPGVRFSVTDGATLTLQDRIAIDRNATLIVKYGHLHVGARTYIGIGSVIVAQESVTIGDDGLIAEYVTIRDQDHSYGGPNVTARNGFITSPVIIGDNVWIGAKATITKGVTIGDNSVIGANSVVTRDVPPNSIYAGAPARLIGYTES